MEILRKKMMNDATAPETISRIRDALTTSAECCVVPEGPAKETTSKVSSSSSLSSTSSPPSSSSLPSSEERKKTGNNDDDDEDDDDDDDVDGEKTDASVNNKNPLTASDQKGPLAIENSINVSGPVTDL